MTAYVVKDIDHNTVHIAIDHGIDLMDDSEGDNEHCSYASHIFCILGNS